MRTAIDFVRTFLTMPKPWLAWIGLMAVVNVIGPLCWLESAEGRATLATAALGMTIQLVIFSRLGFVRLLGIGHIAWVPLVIWLWSRVPMAPDGSLFRTWVLALIVVDSLSLVIDAIDVGRYLSGERAPTIETPA